MSRVALVLAAGMLVPGCFYADPINQRPSITIGGEPTEAVHRKDALELEAIAVDPDGDYVSFRWRAYACNGGPDSLACDDAPFQTGIERTFDFRVPMLRSNANALDFLRVVLEAADELGATARPDEELLIPVVDLSPSLVLDRGSRYSYVTGTPISVFAKVGDTDDGPDALQPLRWELFGPPGANLGTLADLAIAQDPQDPDHRQYAKTFTPNVAGEWSMRVTASDRLGAETMETTMMMVGADAPPCLAQLSPIVPSGGAALPITAPTLFHVPIVIDDLDLYPPQPTDRILGVTKFEWLIQTPGQATHTMVAGATGNSITIDPASYTPGDIIEVRVQIYDRVTQGFAIPCNDSIQTCSVISQPSCIQRQTWRVEVR